MGRGFAASDLARFLSAAFTWRMRRLVLSESVSIDGVVGAPGGEGHLHGAWTMPYCREGLGECAAAEMLAAGGLLLGRVTYRGSTTTWPAGRGDASLDRVGPDEPTIVRGEMQAAVQSMTDRRGRDVLVGGGATLLLGLLAANLVDELRLEVYPVSIGVGTRRLDLATPLTFEVTESTRTSTGVMLLTYGRVPERAGLVVSEGRGPSRVPSDRHQAARRGRTSWL